MTNNDIKQELTLIHESLNALKSLSLKEVQAIELHSFIHLVEEKYDELHRNLTSALDTYELSTTLHTEGKEAALSLIENRQVKSQG